MSVFSFRKFLSASSSCPRFRLLPRRVSSKSSSGSEESEALGVDFSEEGLLIDRVLLSTRPDTPDDEEECWDCELVARAREDRRGDGGAIEERATARRGREEVKVRSTTIVADRACTVLSLNRPRRLFSSSNCGNWTAQNVCQAGSVAKRLGMEGGRVVGR